MADTVRIVVDGDKVRSYFNDAGGDVARWMIQQGQRVKVEAQSRVGVGKVPPAGPPRTRAPGTLRDSIVSRFHMTGDGVVVVVGSEDPIALLHHEGTEPHQITPRDSSVLAFWSDSAGAVVVARVVNHPGTQPNRFLTEAMAAVLG